LNVKDLKILGGMAHTNGVSFYGDGCSAKAYRTKAGDIEVKMTHRRRVPEKLLELMEVPVIRGFADTIHMFYMNWFFGLIFLLAPILMNIRLNFITEHASSPDFMGGFISGFATTIITFILIIRFITDLTKYHGAEHVMHNLYIRENGINLNKIDNRDRFHKWCGSNWIIVLVVYTAVMFFIPIPSVLKVLLWFPLYGEILMNRNKYLEKLFIPFRLLGFSMQLFTTSMPKEKHLEVAQAAFESLMAREAELSLNKIDSKQIANG
jgi:uncharacterized protein YqhQ